MTVRYREPPVKWRNSDKTTSHGIQVYIIQKAVSYIKHKETQLRTWLSAIPNIAVRYRGSPVKRMKSDEGKGIFTILPSM